MSDPRPREGGAGVGESVSGALDWTQATAAFSSSSSRCRP